MPVNSVWAGKTKWDATDPWYQSCRPYQAAIRWVMQNPDLDCAVPGMHSARQMDELYEALQTPFSEEDREILAVMTKAMIDTDIDVQLRREGFEGLNKTIWE